MSPFDQAPAFDGLGQILALARAGDPRALTSLFEVYREPLLRRIRFMMGDEARQLAESSDFLHETFAAALPALSRFEQRDRQSFLRWLTTIARNRIRQDLRRRREHALSMLSSSIRGNGGPAQADPPSLAATLILVEALEDLTDEERQVIDLHDLEGRTFFEISRRLECSERQAQRLHARSLLRLSRALRGR